jgi:predicted Na+-dependent transporter
VCGQKTLPVALLLFETYFREVYPLAVVPLVFYRVGQLIVNTFIAEELARRGTRGERPAPTASSPLDGSGKDF